MQEFRGINREAAQNAAQLDADSLDIDADDLAGLMAVWPTLPIDKRQMIVNLINGARRATDDEPATF